MLLSHIALPLLSLAASALAKPSSDFSLKKRQNNAEAFVVETLKLQTEKIATIQGAFETATQGWSEDDPAPHPGYVAEITNEYHFQVFAALQYTSEAVGNRSTELKAATLDVDNLAVLFAGQVDAVAGDVYPLYVYANASDERYPNGDSGTTSNRFDYFAATGEFMSSRLTDVLKNLTDVAGDQLRQRVLEESANSLDIFRGFGDDYKTFFDALGTSTDAPSQTSTPAQASTTSQAPTSSEAPTSSQVPTSSQAPTTSQASTTSSRASTTTSQASTPSQTSPGEAPGGCSTDPVGCVKIDLKGETANILAVGYKIKAACDNIKNNGPQAIYDSVKDFLYEIHDELLYADEAIGVYEPELDTASLVREFGKLGSDMVNAVCTSLLPLHQLAKNSPKLQGHLKGELGLLDNGSANVVKRLLNLDERLKAAFRAGLNHARLRTLAGFGDVFVELPTAIGGIKPRATKA